MSDSTGSGGPTGERAIAPLTVFYFVHFAAFGAFLPFFPRWLEGRGLSGLEMGFVLGVPPLVGVFAPPIVGAIADALGLRSQLLRLSAVVATAAMLGLAAISVAQGAPASFAGAAAIAAFVAVMALARTPLFGIADVVTLEALGSRVDRFGRVRLWGSLGFVATAATLGFVIDMRSAAALPLAIGVLFGATAVAAYLVPARPAKLAHADAAAVRSMIRHAPFFVAIALWQFANAAYDTVYTLRVREAGLADAHAGILWGAGVVAEVVLMAFAVRVLGAASPRALFVFAMAASSARWALTSLAGSLVSLSLLQPLHAVTFGLTWIVANAHLFRIAPAGRLATVQGALTASVAAGSVAGNVLWPWVHERFGAGAPFLGAALAAGVAMVPGWLIGNAAPDSRRS